MMTAAERALQKIQESQARYERNIKRADRLENIALALVGVVVLAAFVVRLFT